MTATASMVDSVLAGIHEAGGEVLVARTVSGATAWARSCRVVSGSILDSTTKAGIGGATVELRGTPHHATTDPAGSFRFDSLPPGTYTMLVTLRAPVILLRAITLTVDDSPVRADMVVPATAIAIANAERERSRLVGQCAELRLAREREIDSTLAVPISKWLPSGGDSLAVARAVRQISAVLQAIADTTGHVDLRSVRALKRSSDAAYAAAHAALATLEPAVDEPMPGCKLRRVVVLPYRVRAR